MTTTAEMEKIADLERDVARFTNDVARLKRWHEWHLQLNRDLIAKLRSSELNLRVAISAVTDQVAKRMMAERPTSDQPDVHLWWNGEDHAPGATAEDAQRWAMQESGEPPEKCLGPLGWHQLPDDYLIPVEEEHTAAAIARGMLERSPLRAEENPLAS